MRVCSRNCPQLVKILSLKTLKTIPPHKIVNGVSGVINPHKVAILEMQETGVNGNNQQTNNWISQNKRTSNGANGASKHNLTRAIQIDHAEKLS